MRRLFYSFFALALAGLFNCTAHAELRLPAVVSDGMVLQRQSSVALWGWAEPGSTVVAKPGWPGGESAEAAVDASGKWLLRVKTPTGPGPFSIQFINGDEHRCIEDVLIGEVWVASGQSNMEMIMNGYINQPIEGSLEAILDSRDSGVRMFKVRRATSKTPADDCVGGWVASDPSTTGDFSAVAYFFARAVRKATGVPIGMITASWGGTPVQPWQSPEVAAPESEWQQKTRDGKDQYKPAYLFNGMIHPLIPYGIRGAIWYQGESNWRSPESYAGEFSSMVESWRKAWGVGDFPFYFTQIAPYDYKDANYEGEFDDRPARLREAQLKAAQQLNNVGMAVLMDIGTERVIHPPKKREVGQRLALLALEHTYGMSGLESDSPQLASMEVDGALIRLTFDHCDRGFIPPAGGYQQFEVAGADQVFYPATSVSLKRGYLEISCEQVPDPVAVRYAWKDWVVGDLISTGGLPASSFRTDDWDRK